MPVDDIGMIAGTQFSSVEKPPELPIYGPHFFCWKTLVSGVLRTIL
jgi:hypothetical protein